MTFADVARRVGLNTTSVTYYFKRKEDLAAACFEHTLDRLQAMLDESLARPTPQARVAHYLALNMERFARIERGEEQAFAVLSDLRAMEEPVRSRLLAGLAARVPHHSQPVGPGGQSRPDATCTARGRMCCWKTPSGCRCGSSATSSTSSAGSRTG